MRFKLSSSERQNSSVKGRGEGETAGTLRLRPNP